MKAELAKRLLLAYLDNESFALGREKLLNFLPLNTLQECLTMSRQQNAQCTFMNKNYQLCIMYNYKLQIMIPLHLV